MQKPSLILILCLLSFTASNQVEKDSLVCFTKGQAKQILFTKVELNNCLDSYDLIQSENNALSDTLTVLRSDITKTQRKLVRNRKLAIGGVSTSILLTLLIILL